MWPGLRLIGAGGKIPKGVFVAVAEVEPDGVRLDNGMRLKNQELLRATRPSHTVTYAARGSPSTTASAWTCHLTLRHLYVGASRATSSELLVSFLWRTQKRCHSASEMKQSGTGPFFCRFCSTSKAVSRCVKNEAEGHRALVKHRDARAGERHQLVRHRAVQALEGEPGKVARAGADTTQRHLGHALGGKAGNEAVAPCRRS